jgi:hypothetical protein
MRTKQIIGLIVLGCIIASLAVLAGLMAALGAATGIVVGLLIASGVTGTYLLLVGPWQRRWGATDEEVRRAMPGDALLRPDAPSTTRAITVDASPEVVFPWLLQIGYGRGGWYSYDWIDNDGKPSIERIDPALQRLGGGRPHRDAAGLRARRQRDRDQPSHRERRQNRLLVPAGRTHARGSDTADQPVEAGLAEVCGHLTYGWRWRIRGRS